MSVFPTHKTRIFMRYRPQVAPASPYVNKWLRIGEVSNYGEISSTFEELRFDAVSRTTAVIRKGRREPIRIPLTLGFDYNDTGQQLLADALEDRVNEYMFKIKLSDEILLSGGIYEYTRLAFRAQVSQLSLTPGGASDWLIRNTTLLVNANGGVRYLRTQKATFLPTIEDEEDEEDTQVQLEDPYYEEEEEE